MDLGYYTYIAAFTVSNNTLVNQQPTLHIIKLILQTLITELVHCSFFSVCILCRLENTNLLQKQKRSSCLGVPQAEP